MTHVFLRPKGVSADVAELEYVSALHQTCMPGLRLDGSIYAEDIKLYLLSRHGIQVSKEQVQKTILDGLSCGVEEGDCFDIMEIVSILLIPFLRKIGATVLAEKSILSFSSEIKTVNSFGSEWEYNEYLRLQEVSEKLAFDDSLMMDDVLSTILLRATGETSPKPLSKTLLKEICFAFGEKELVENDKLLEEMIQCCMSEKDVEPPILNSKTLIRALTNDIHLYDVENERKMTSHFFDVFQTYDGLSLNKKEQLEEKKEKKVKKEKKKKKKKKDGEQKVDKGAILHASFAAPSTDEEEDIVDEEAALAPSASNLVPSEEEQPNTFKVIFTANSIDWQVDTYRSKGFSVLIWITFVVLYFSYAFRLMSEALQAHAFQDCEKHENHHTKFGCQLGNGVSGVHIVAAELSVIGTVFVSFGSIGNNNSTASKPGVLFSMVVVVFFTIIPNFLNFDALWVSTYKSGYYFPILHWIAFGLGIFLLLCQFVRLITLFSREDALEKNNSVVAAIVTNRNMRFEAQMKQASAFKLNKMVKNALKLIRTNHLNDIIHFISDYEDKEVVGGCFWTWKKMISGTLYTEEGVWFPARLAIASVSILVANFVFVGLGAYLGNEWYKDTFEDDDLDGDKQAFIAAMATGLVFGFLASTRLFFFILPSTTSTVLQLRSGLIPSLRDERHFFKYRLDVGSISVLLPCMIWGAIYTFIFTGLVVFCLIYFSFWSGSTKYASMFWAAVLSLVSLVNLKKIIVKILRLSYFTAYFRTSPWASNLSQLSLECYSLVGAVGTMALRTVVLVVTSLLYIGRVDVPFLGPEASLGGHLDPTPSDFKKEVLLHEAHRHPYMETLGMMYMMKLRHGDKFAKAHGNSWRLLFVHGLMPWLRRYRLRARPELNKIDDAETAIDRENIGLKSTANDEDSIIEQANEEISRLSMRSFTSDCTEFQALLKDLTEDQIAEVIPNAEEESSLESEEISKIKNEINWLDKQERVIQSQKRTLKQKLTKLQRDAANRLDSLDVAHQSPTSGDYSTPCTSVGSDDQGKFSDRSLPSMT